MSQPSPAPVRNRILLISYLFPPAGGIPVQRILSLARFLPENGYEVHVLCCSNPGVPTLDPGLLERVPQEVAIHRVFSPELSFAMRQRLWSILSLGRGGKQTKSESPEAAAPGKPPFLKRTIEEIMRRIYCPDPEVLWVPFALREAKRLIRAHKIDTVLVTMPPYSSILVGLKLKRIFPRIRLIADFRDEWLDYYLNAFPFYRSAYIQKRAAAIERQTAEQADAIVTVTGTVQRQMQRRYPDIPATKFRLVSNGFDADALGGFESRRHTLAPDRAVISYAGTMHETSSPKQYFDALDRLPEPIRTRVQTRMIGRVTGDLEHLLHNRKSEIQRYGFLPQQDAFRLLEETDYLLLIQHHSPSLSGKLYEYLAMGKPILAITAGNSEVAKVIADTGAGLSADPDDLEAVGRMLTRAVDALKPGGQPVAQHRWDVIQKFDRRHLTREYAGVMRSAAAADHLFG